MKKSIGTFFLKLAILFGARISQGLVSQSPGLVEALASVRPSWSIAEARGVSSFLASGVGQSFSRRIRAVAAQVAIQGAKERHYTIHSAGISAGWDECVRYMHSLGSCQHEISRVSGEQDISRVGSSDSQDRQPVEDESALLERLSS